MNLVKTNIPGFVKDKKQNVIIPMNVEEKVEQVKLNRKRYKKQLSLERTIEQMQMAIIEMQNKISELQSQMVNMRSRIW
jgi:TolA-binding protein